MNIKEALDRSGYYFITSSSDNPVTIKPVLETVVDALKGGAKVIQYREKKLSFKDMCDIAFHIRLYTWQYDALFIINDNVRLAGYVGADGVHLGQNDTPYWLARSYLGWNKIIGVSASTSQQAQQAILNGADYISMSPVLKTSTKIEGNVIPAGIESLEIMRKMMDQEELRRVPIVAIGGVNKSNYRDLILFGADAVCSINAVLGHNNIPSNIESLNISIDKARQGRIVYK